MAGVMNQCNHGPRGHHHVDYQEYISSSPWGASVLSNPYLSPSVETAFPEHAQGLWTRALQYASLAGGCSETATTVLEHTGRRETYHSVRVETPIGHPFTCNRLQ